MRKAEPNINNWFMVWKKTVHLCFDPIYLHTFSQTLSFGP